MATFKVLTGKALASAISGFGKKAATFAAATHQLAYSAINHVELHHCASHLNGLYAATPVNYRKALVSWATAFAKVTFDAKELAFVYAKGKASDLPGAMAVSPADYIKAASGAAQKFDEIKRLESVIKTFTENNATPAVLAALQGALRLAKAEVVGKLAAAAPVAPSPRKVVVPATEMVQARKAKAAAPAKVAKAA